MIQATSYGSTGLLVSVRSAEEARTALLGGADLIDVKEPSRGPLGAASPLAIREVIAAVGGRVPVSAALGEWANWVSTPVPPGLTYVKWGLANSTAANARGLRDAEVTGTGPAPVLVAYADHCRANSPEPDELVECACDLHFPAFLFDTAVKDGTTLLDWLTVDDLIPIRRRLAAAGVRVAFAGSLDAAAIGQLRQVAPDWFAVRGAACVGGREGRLSAERVRTLRTFIKGSRIPAAAD
ncbi:MAG TPA: (5-formylfuran-3-yl)methyl phosphate synthase [Gemmataceae bacterium]|nr:(5-formylfuran-3-yl)methyl phosphate synthase [Gemmataceae bacterium]